MAKIVVCALVNSRLDYANSVLFGATQKNISKPQKAQNLLALFSSIMHPCTLLQQLHWLPIKHCIDFKIANITISVLFIVPNRLAPKIWNSFPLSLRTCTSPDTFRRHLKTHYCQQAFHST